MSSVPRKSSVFGLWPMATNTPWAGYSVTSPVFWFSRRTAWTPPSREPRTSVTTLFHCQAILALAKARSCMIFEARSASRRWTTVTLLAKRVRKVASSIAVSPPPTTTTSLSRKKKPSQVAQAETP